MKCVVRATLQLLSLLKFFVRPSRYNKTATPPKTSEITNQLCGIYATFITEMLENMFCIPHAFTSPNVIDTTLPTPIQIIAVISCFFSHVIVHFNRRQ